MINYKKISQGNKPNNRQNIRRKKVDNIGEQKTKGKSNKVEEKRQQRKSLLKNTGAADTSNKNKSKIQEERKERKKEISLPGRNKSLDTSGKSKIAEVDSSKREKFKTKQAIKNRPGAVDTSNKNKPTKIQEERKKRTRAISIPGKDKSLNTQGKSLISEVDSSKREKFKTKQAIKNRPGEVKTSGPSSVDNSQRGKRTTKVDQFVTKMKMKADNIIRESNNRNKELYKMIHGKEYAPPKKLKDGGTVGKSRSYRGYGAARKG